MVGRQACRLYTEAARTDANERNDAVFLEHRSHSSPVRVVPVGTFRKSECSGNFRVRGKKAELVNSERRGTWRLLVRGICGHGIERFALSPGCAVLGGFINRSSSEAARIPTKIITTVGLPDRLHQEARFALREKIRVRYDWNSSWRWPTPCPRINVAVLTSVPGPIS